MNLLQLAMSETYSLIPKMAPDHGPLKIFTHKSLTTDFSLRSCRCFPLNYFLVQRELNDNL